jgi:hypothetical protein
MLAWTIVQHERANEARLWTRVHDMFPVVYASVTGNRPVPWPLVVRYVLLKQGATITPNKLLQRADKAERYCEWTPEKDAVVAAYLEVVRSKYTTR